MCGAGFSSPASVPSSASEALAALRGGLAFLAGADPRTLTSVERADCLRELERAESVRVAARSAVLTAFEADCGFADDGHGGSRSWLRWQARITGAAAAGAVRWTRRLAEHQAVRGALAGGELSVSWAREICDWTDQLPGDVRDDADAILLAASAAGAELADLAALAQELRARTAQPDQDDPDDGFEDRALRLDRHFRGAGRLRGDLTPRCAAALRAVLDALGKKSGPEDTRTIPQRQHDALEEALRRLIASGCLPDRAGQSTQIQLQMTLQDLLGDGGSEPAATWLPGAMAGDDCDASIAPVVTGRVDYDLLDRLAGHGGPPGGGSSDGGPAADGAATMPAGFRPSAAVRQQVIAAAVDLLSGPGGLASWLRTGRLTGPAASISLPLDLGAPTEVIPPHLRRAVITRDKHCAFAGCEQPPAVCQVHHIRPRSQGGLTELSNLLLLCSFHHLVAVHQWGWTIVLNADGTTTATSPEGARVLRSHSPPAAPAA